MSYTWAPRSKLARAAPAGAPRSIELDLSGGRPVALRHVLGQLGAPPAATALALHNTGTVPVMIHQTGRRSRGSRYRERLLNPGGGSARRGSPDPRCPDLRREVAPLLPDLIAMGCPSHLAGDLAAVLWFFGPPAVAGAAWILARPAPVPPDRRWWNK